MVFPILGSSKTISPDPREVGRLKAHVQVEAVEAVVDGTDAQIDVLQNVLPVERFSDFWGDMANMWLWLNDLRVPNDPQVNDHV